LSKDGTHSVDGGDQMVIKCSNVGKEERENQNARAQGKGIS
jgi:hypothetical protein